MSVDISPEAVERFEPYISEDWRGMMGVTAAMRPIAKGKYVRVEVYEAQAARIAELEEVAPLLEPFRKHLEHARREGYLAGAQAVHAEWSEKDADFSEAANDYALALIEGDTHDR